MTLTDEQKKKIVEMHAEGVSLYAIAKELGVPYVKVYYFFHKDYFIERNKINRAKKREKAKAEANQKIEQNENGGINGVSTI